MRVLASPALQELAQASRAVARWKKDLAVKALQKFFNLRDVSQLTVVIKKELALFLTSHTEGERNFKYEIICRSLPSHMDRMCLYSTLLQETNYKRGIPSKLQSAIDWFRTEDHTRVALAA